MLLDRLKADLRDHFGDQARWVELSGGRTNRVWRVRQDGKDLVCKLYLGANQNPMFANMPEAEFACLEHLSGQDIAPEPVAFVTVPTGKVLIYQFVEASAWQFDMHSVARLLRKVHRLSPPNRLPHSPAGSAQILDHASAILANLPTESVKSLCRLCPEGPETPDVDPSFLHGDVVAANLLQTASGLRLIDWQCPAVGDPTSDLACFLSPAMQVVYGAGPLQPEQEATFLTAYDDAEIADRYLALRPAYHFRMAAYCLWRVAQGDEDYRPAYEAEKAALALCDL